MTRGMQVRKFIILIATIYLSLLGLLVWPTTLQAQDPVETGTPVPTDEKPEVPAQVDVEPLAQDEEINERLTRILRATEWFINPTVEVRDGVVFLDGQTQAETYREWAGDLARNTQDVVAVVNRLEVIPQSAWDFSPALAEIRAVGRSAAQSLPLMLFGLAILLLSWWLARTLAQLSYRMLSDRLGSPLLTTVMSRTIAIPIFLLGVYLVLQVAGLTPLALTLLGGTGLMGIIVGFAFRDIAENFLASILLSIRQPFQSDDVIEVAGYTGVVQQMNTRSTILMTLEGNHVQIPNSIIFKSSIVNYTANPNRRFDFSVGIGYDNAILDTQELLMRMLEEHPAVLETPEPLVLVEALGAATITLRVYYWYDATQYAPFKVSSSLFRLTKRTLEEAGVSMPDEAREVIFPQGVPVVPAEPPPEPAVGGSVDGQESRPRQPTRDVSPSEPVTSAAEGDLRSEDQEIQEQAKQSRVLEEGQNLLEGK